MNKGDSAFELFKGHKRAAVVFPVPSVHKSQREQV